MRMNNMNSQKTENKSAQEYVCCECGSHNIETIWQDHTFPYGVGDQCVQLTCKVPVRNCKGCDFSFMDDEAEDLRHEEVCRHLGVMSPTKIKQLRELHGMTQSEFAAFTKLGEATLSRWERGIVVQNQAYDNYLYLLGFEENKDLITKRAKRDELAQILQASKRPTFREIDANDEQLLRRQQEFELQPTV